MSFVPQQGKGAIIPAVTGIAFGHTPNKPPVPWPTVMTMFKTTSDPSPMSALLIAMNTMLEQDKAMVLAC